MDFGDRRLREIGVLQVFRQPDEEQWPEGIAPDPPVIPDPRQAPRDCPSKPERDRYPARDRQVPDKLPARGQTRCKLSDVYMH